MVYSSRLWSILRLCHGVAAPLLLWALTVSGTVLCDRGVFGASASAARSRGWWLSDLERCDGGKRQRLRFALAKSEAHEAKPDCCRHSSGFIFDRAVQGTPSDHFRSFCGALADRTRPPTWGEAAKKQRPRGASCATWSSALLAQASLRTRLLQTAQPRHCARNTEARTSRDPAPQGH